MGEDKKRTMMDNMKDIIVDRLELEMVSEEIKDDTILFSEEGLGLDSIDALELVVGIEESFGVLLTNDDREAFASVRTLVDYILESFPDKQVIA